MGINNFALHNVNMIDFINILDTCKGDVFLETPEGDVLNLRSKLCQIVGLATILQGCSIAEAVIRCTDPEDEEKLFRFNLYKEIPKDVKK